MVRIRSKNKLEALCVHSFGNWLRSQPPPSAFTSSTLAVMCEGHQIRTVESLEVEGRLDPLQLGFHEMHALHCGFCTPGMLMTARALLDENPDPSEAEIRTAISGAICRCTGYKNIVSAVRWAAEHEAANRQGQEV